jgi:hypothetical protein
MDLQRILSTPRLAKAATGLTASEFEALAEGLGALWEKPLRRRTARGALRQRQPGGGRKGQLSDPRLKLCFILFYFRVYPTQEVMGLFFGLSQPQVCAWVHRLTPLLQATLGRACHLPTRQPARLHQVLAQCPELAVILDGTERPVRRPQAEPAQREHYSGRRKTHTVKNVLLVADRKVRALSATRPGRVHDKRVTEEEWAGRRFPHGTLLLGDSGFAGYRPTGATLGGPVKARRGEELGALDRRYNLCLSRARVPVEHVLSGVKRSRIVSDEFRNRKAGFVDTVMELACGLHNLRTHHRPTA